MRAILNAECVPAMSLYPKSEHSRFALRYAQITFGSLSAWREFIRRYRDEPVRVRRHKERSLGIDKSVMRQLTWTHMFPRL